jgi:co-chaperonin GroES (HSP10)
MLRMPRKNVAVVPLFDTLKVGSLYIPEQARERCDQGIVKYVGTKCEYVKEGDHVVFSGYTGTLLSLEGEGLLIVLPEQFVVAVIEYDASEVAGIEIPGLFFKGSDGEFFPATYEMATGILAKGIEESPFWSKLTGDKHRHWKLHEQRPALAEYEREDDD